VRNQLLNVLQQNQRHSHAQQADTVMSSSLVQLAFASVPGQVGGSGQDLHKDLLEDVKIIFNHRW
jgi:hypothetical protein